jgi:hypothetical protein
VISWGGGAQAGTGGGECPPACMLKKAVSIYVNSLAFLDAIYGHLYEFTKKLFHS